MDIQTIRLLATYNQSINAKMNDIITKLTPDQWKKAWGGYFASIRSLCNHIYIADFNWLKRFSGLRKFKYMENTFFQGTLSFDKIVLDGPDDYIKKRKALDEHIIDFVEELNPDDLAKQLIYKDIKGNPFEKPFGGLILHMFNHETHHRGMIAIYLDLLKIDNDFSSLAAIL